jgi:hypothetical protein
METIFDFVAAAKDDNITVELKNLKVRPGFVPAGNHH